MQTPLEIVGALTTTVFLWLLMGYTYRLWLARHGPAQLVVWGSMVRYPWVLAAMLLGLVFVSILAGFNASRFAHVVHQEMFLAVYWLSISTGAFCVGSAVLLFTRLRIHEHGISFATNFIPWSRIVYCQLRGHQARLVVQLARRKVSLCVKASDIAAIIAALKPHVEVRDTTGAVLSLPSCESSGDPNANRTKWFQFDLRWLFLLTMFVAAATSWLALVQRRFAVERRAIEHLGQFSGVGTPAAALPWVDLSNSKITDDDLAYFADLPHVRELVLRGCPITDEGVAHLRGLTHLHRLDVRETGISPDGAAALSAALPHVVIQATPQGEQPEAGP
jgi:uncharacterized membrane protein YobD (UPF0266 family)